MIRKILTILLPVLFFPAVGTSTKVYETRAFDNDIRSIRIWNESRNPLLPVIELGSPDKILLRRFVRNPQHIQLQNNTLQLGLDPVRLV